MRLNTLSCFVVLVMLMMIIDPANFAAIDDFNLPGEGKKSDAQMYYELIPVEKRGAFIRRYLEDALVKDGYFKDTTTFNLADRIVQDDFEREFGSPPPNFSQNLLIWTKDTFNLEDQEVEMIVQSTKRVCIPSKGCYDPENIGEHCCLF